MRTCEKRSWHRPNGPRRLNTSTRVVLRVCVWCVWERAGSRRSRQVLAQVLTRVHGDTHIQTHTRIHTHTNTNERRATDNRQISWFSLTKCVCASAASKPLWIHHHIYAGRACAHGRFATRERRLHRRILREKTSQQHRQTCFQTIQFIMRQTLSNVCQLSRLNY